MDDNPTPTPVSALLQRLREERGLSLYALERRSGLDRGHLRRIETGATWKLEPATMQKLADALDVDVEDFYEAHWQTTGQPLPSLPTYFRTKHHSLTDADIAEIEAFVERTEQAHRTSGDGSKAESDESVST
jgi:transcriptional regulator with XRE-family HTH domain